MQGIIAAPKSKRAIPHHAPDMLKTARKQHGLTRQQAADKSGVAIRHYQMFERGTRNLHSASLQVTMAVYRALDIDPKTL